MVTVTGSAGRSREVPVLPVSDLERLAGLLAVYGSVLVRLESPPSRLFGVGIPVLSNALETIDAPQK